jgi:glycosyltransferase involved in cell wall biosynthesis
LWKRIGGRRIRSLWAGTPIINMANNARAESLLGIDAKSLVYKTYYITGEFDYNLERLTSLPVVGWLVPLGAFFWACLVVDRLHFYCDRGLLPPIKKFTFDYVEMIVYRLLNIQVFLWTYGADIRRRDITLAMGDPNCCTNCDDPGKYCICDEKAQARNVTRLSRLSNAIFSGMGDMFDYTPGSINDTYFWPVDLAADNGKKYSPAYVDKVGHGALCIVHASNHRIFKGTDYLIRAVEELKADGVNIELVLVEKMANHEALKVYRKADIIFDQCIMGNYGYFALEAMALGKPVLCFLRDPAKYILNSEECPIINTHLSTLKEDIARLTSNREYLHNTGKKGRFYVEKYFSLEAFAARLKDAYERIGISPEGNVNR